MTKRRLADILERPTVAWTLVVLAALLPYLPFLRAWFFMDDFVHLDALLRGDYVFSVWRAGREDLDSLWYMEREVMTNMAWVEQVQYYFRPVYLMGVWLDLKLFGFEAAGYHLHSLLWHVANAALLFAVLLRMELSRPTALLAALLFAVHPAASEPIGWISSRCDLQATGLCLLSLWFWLSWKESGRFRVLFACFASYFLALGAKEHALAFPFILAFFDLARRLFPGKERYGKPDFSWVPLVVAALAFFTWRILDDGGPGTWSMVKANYHAFKAYGPLAATGYNLIQYVKLAITGMPMVPFFIENGLPPLVYALALVPMMLAIFAGLWFLRGSRGLFFALWALGFLFSMIWLAVCGRYLYFALPGLAALVAIGLKRGMDFESIRRARLAKILTAVLLLIGFSMSAMHSVTATEFQRRIHAAVDEIGRAVRERPEVKDLYLLHVWPPMIAIHGLLAEMFERPDLDVQVLTFSSSFYHSKLPAWTRNLASLLLPAEENWRLKLNTSTRKLDENAIAVESEPLGFFYGPGLFGWDSSMLPQMSGKTLHLKKMTVRPGLYLENQGIRRMMFRFPKPVSRPDALWMEFRDGEMRVWNPDSAASP